MTFCTALLGSLPHLCPMASSPGRSLAAALGLAFCTCSLSLTEYRAARCAQVAAKWQALPAGTVSFMLSRLSDWGYTMSGDLLGSMKLHLEEFSDSYAPQVSSTCIDRVRHAAVQRKQPAG